MEEQLLSILADGEFHSGDELGDRLGISRAAVWKRVQKIQALGVPLVSIKGKGYQISGGLNLLSTSAVEAYLHEQTRQLISELELLDVVASTNQLALQRAQRGQAGYVCSAEQQTAGRGRRGRQWVSPYAANIYTSLVWEFTGGAKALEGLSLAVGVAVAEALDLLGVQQVRLKWPNDVLWGDRKLAGVLIEMVGDAAGPCQVVVGIGVNVAMPSGCGAQIDQPWVDINSIVGTSTDRNRLLAHLLNSVVPLLARFEHNTFAAYRERWQALDAFYEQPVSVWIGETVQVGVARGVDASGAVIVDTPMGRQAFSGGELSLRREP